MTDSVARSRSPGGLSIVSRSGTRPRPRDAQMAREAAVNVVAGEDLPGTDPSVPSAARGALAAGDHRGHDDLPADPTLGARSGLDHATADLVSKRQRKTVPRRHAVVVVPEVGMADAAALDCDQDVSRRGGLIPLGEDHRCVGLLDGPRSDAHGLPRISEAAARVPATGGLVNGSIELARTGRHGSARSL